MREAAHRPRADYSDDLRAVSAATLVVCAFLVTVVLVGVVARTGALAAAIDLSCGAWASLASSAGQASAPALTNASACWAAELSI